MQLGKYTCLHDEGWPRSEMLMGGKGDLPQHAHGNNAWYDWIKQSVSQVTLVIIRVATN